MMKIIKFIGIVCLVLLILLIWLFSGIFAQPLHVLITTTVITMALYKMLKRENCWYKIAVVGIFIIVGVWYVFYNEIPGPMTWLICDRPIDTPSQWFECYRFYWSGDVIYTTSLRGGIISFVFIFIVRLISKSKYNQNRSNNETGNVTK